MATQGLDQSKALADLNIQQAGDGLGSVGLVCGMTSVPMLLHVVPAFGLRAGPEKEELSKAVQGLHGFGYGEDVCSVGLDMLQMPSLRVVLKVTGGRCSCPWKPLQAS